MFVAGILYFRDAKGVMVDFASKYFDVDLFKTHIALSTVRN